MALAFSNGGSTASASAVGQFDLDASAAEDGDIYVVHIVVGGDNAITTPSGWTAQYNPGAGSPEGGQTHGIFSRQMTGSETTVTFDWASTNQFAATVLRVTSDTGTVDLSDFTVSSTTTDGASPYTTQSITANDGFIIYGAGGEGSSASTTWSQSHGDTPIADVTSGTGTGESVAVYRSSGTHSGSISKTMAVSTNDRFAATWWIAEVSESAPTEVNAPAGTATPSVTVNAATTAVAPVAGHAPVSAVANAASTSGSVSAPAGHASVSVVANSPSAANPLEGALVTAFDATVDNVVAGEAPAGHASVSVAANAPVAALAPSAGHAAGSVVAEIPSTGTLSSVSISTQANASRNIVGAVVKSFWSLVVYAVDIGNGTDTSYTVTHNLGTKDVLVVVYETASPYEEVMPTSVQHSTTTTLTITFPSAPSTNQYRVAVMYAP